VSEKVRLFVAVIPPPAVLDLIERFPRPEEPGVRYTTREQWHVTLRFFGPAPVEAATEALDGLQATQALGRVHPTVSKLGREIVALGIDGFEGLATEVCEATAHVGQAPWTQPFRGHLTLARLKAPFRSSMPGTPITASFRAREIVLMRSHLEPTGARYEPLATWSLLPEPPLPAEDGSS
jgi:2'-5' RNA ligase